MLIAILEPCKYQLSHDGYFQFGLLDDQDGRINEVVLAPTKHFQVWLNDEKRFRLVMEQYRLQEDNNLQFLDEYPHTTVRLPEANLLFREPSELLKHLADEIEASSRKSLH